MGKAGLLLNSVSPRETELNIEVQFWKPKPSFYFVEIMKQLSQVSTESEYVAEL